METRQKAGCPYNLLFAVFCARDESNGFHMSKVDVPSEDIHVQQLADVFLLVVATKAALYKKDYSRTRGQFSFGKKAKNVGQKGWPLLPLNFVRMLAISLLILFSSSSRTRPRG